MTYHLTDEQLEQCILGELPPAEHVDQCAHCQARLDEHRALRGRLKQAFATVSPRSEFLAGLKLQVLTRSRLDQAAHDAPAPRRARVLPFVRAAAVAAAAVITMAIVLPMMLPGTVRPQAQMSAIHQQSLLHNEPVSPTELAAYFREQLGYVPAIPQGEGLNYFGCRTGTVQDRLAATYSVQVGQERITVIALPVNVESLGFGGSFQHGGQAFWVCRDGACRMVSLQIGEMTYVAMGENAPRETLVNLLSTLAQVE